MGSSNSKKKAAIPTMDKIMNCHNDGTFSGSVRVDPSSSSYGMAEGQGVYVSSNAKYMGNWVDGKQCGAGEEVTSDGTIFKSNYKDCSRDGKTTVVKDGVVYVGTSVKGKLNGPGKVYLKDGSSWDAFFVGDYLVRGTLSHPEYTYTGAAYGLRPHGTGVKTLKDGTRLEGTFHDDHFTGSGRITHPNGHIEVGIFINGRLVEAGFLNEPVTPGNDN